MGGFSRGTGMAVSGVAVGGNPLPSADFSCFFVLEVRRPAELGGAFDCHFNQRSRNREWR